MGRRNGTQLRVQRTLQLKSGLDELVYGLIPGSRRGSGDHRTTSAHDLIQNGERENDENVRRHRRRRWKHGKRRELSPG